MDTVEKKVSIARDASAVQVAKELASWLNSYNNPSTRGIDVGKVFSEEHRTLQSLAVQFLLGAIISMADNSTGTDPRNSTAIQVCRDIRTEFNDRKTFPMV